MASDQLAGLDFDPYELLGITLDASPKDLKMAYRKKALEYHPDKNPERKNWAETKFQQLSKAFELLSDEAGRKAYDAVLKAKDAAKARARKVDAKRRKFREDLEAREAGAKTQAEEESAAMRRLEAEIARLRKEGSAMVEREREEVEREVRADVEKKRTADANREPPRLKAKWANKAILKGTYDKDDLRKLFESYGIVKELIVAGSGKSALLEFASPDSGLLAFRRETGIIGDPIKLSWVSGRPEDVCETNDVPPSRFPNSAPSQAPPPSAYFPSPLPSAPSRPQDFEATVLQRMADAQKRKEQLKTGQQQSTL